MWKVAVEACFKVRSQHPLEETEKNNGNGLTEYEAGFITTELRLSAS
jgi:hypothetical protein